MAILAQGSFCIRQLIDGKSLTFNLSSNLGDTQIESKDPTSYNPNYSTSNLKIIPSLVVSGGGSDNKVVSACRWAINGDDLSVAANKTKWGATVNTSGDYSLSIAKNLSDTATMTIKAHYTYTDPISAATTEVYAEKTITKVVNAGTTILALLTTPKGDTFKRVAGVVTSLEIQADMIRGGDIDNVDVAYQWAKLSGGNFVNLTDNADITGSTAKTLTVKSNAVVSMEQFRCTITDTDSGSSTSGKTAVGYAMLYDMTDPYDIKVELPQGDGVNPAAGNNSIAAKFTVVQNGVEMNDDWYNAKTLRFARNTAAGVPDISWVPSPSFPGWTANGGIVSRTFASGQATVANRTIAISHSHLIGNKAQTVFITSIEG